MRPPEEWATGGEPMTDRQIVALERVAAHDKVSIPFLERADANGQRVTKAEAYVLIQMILDGVRPSEEYLDSLGRGDPYEEPPHPIFWKNCHARPTDMQVLWIKQLAVELGVPSDATQIALEQLTRGQASFLIADMRDKRREMRLNRRENMRVWLEDAVEGVRAELPAPVKVENEVGAVKAVPQLI
ncbi:hypothetical protein PYCCODRAFT_1437182 [Trametes coccinea BRFM310]|uniref:Uncharacterized protein n=1 Tax=Trametes coccinea (strain BRFM310) TaxID=1353009 RepID=A0A1Y2IIZ1_TRAC3|nr:hypothetical protein PYCCODRAFT_1437182 [Trametes coccinea BRFM310]